MPKKIKASTSNCTSCGDNMMFNPDTDSLFCPSCKSVKEIKSTTTIAKHDVEDSNTFTNNTEWLKQKRAMQCPNCGASVMLNNYEVTQKCPYCDTSLIVSDNTSSIVQPDGIIPFKISRKNAEAKFIEQNKSRAFAPKKFKESVSADEIHGYYFPAFVFEAKCESSYHARLYTTSTKKDSNGFTETTKHYFTIQGNKKSLHKNIEIEASANVTQGELSAIRPYDFSEAKTYTDDFVFGYGFECNNETLQKTSNHAKSIIESKIKREILSTRKHDGVENFHMDNHYESFKYSYYALPIYRINYTYKNKKYSNVLNGQTGTLGGSYPKSKAKIIAMVISILAIVGLPVLLFVLGINGIL